MSRTPQFKQMTRVPPAMLATLKAMVAEHGHIPTADRLGVASTTLDSLRSGRGVQPKTLEKVATALQSQKAAA